MDPPLISPARLDSNVISTAVSMFSGSVFKWYKYQHCTTEVEEAGNEKSKIVVYNTDMHVYIIYTSSRTR
jgi:hypothetical protein